jgi:hypothetical protein
LGGCITRAWVSGVLSEILARQVWIRVTLTTWDNFPLQLSILFKILSTRGCTSSLLSLSKCRGTPMYFIGKEPT